jgi:hypothetical protein
MSTRSGGRHRRQHSSQGRYVGSRGDFAGFVTALQVRQQQRAAMRVGAVAAGAVVAGAALVGAAQVGGLNPAKLFQPQQRDVALRSVSDSTPTFDESLAALLNDLGIGDQTIPGLIGNTVTVGDVLGADGLDVSSPLSALLADLNPDALSLDAVTGGLLTDTVGTLAGDLYLGGTPLDGLTIDGLASDLLGADPATTSVYDLFNSLGLGSFAGLVDICTGTDVLGVCLGSSLTDTSDVSQLLQYFDGGLDPSTTTVGDWLGETDLTGTSTPLADAELGTLLGLSSTQISEPWDQFLDSITITAPLARPETLGDETLGTLLTDLVYTPNLGDLGTGDVVTDATTLANFLTALDPTLATETIDQLLGLTTTASAEAVASLF